MKIVLYTVATAREPWSDEAARLYTQKIAHFNSFEIQNLKPKKSSRDEAEQKKKAESELILSSLTNDDYVIVFDERGRALNSLDFSKKVENILGSSKKRAVLIKLAAQIAFRVGYIRI